MTDSTTAATELQAAQASLEAAKTELLGLPAAIASVLAQAHIQTDDIATRTQAALDAVAGRLSSLPDAIAAALADAQNAAAARVSELLADLGIAYVQLPGDGTTDITSALQAALKPNCLHLLSPGQHVVDAVKSISFPAGARLSIDGSVIVAMANGSPGSAVFKMNAPGAELIGGEIVGERATHIDDPNSTDEWGMGVLIGKGGDGSKITGTKIRDCNGDGVKVSGNVRDVELRKLKCNNNRRNGLSITGAANMLVEDSDFEDTNGTSPQAGIDIEPNTGERATGIRIVRCGLRRNAWGLNIQNALVDGVDIIDCISEDNRSVGMANQGGLNVRITSTTPGATKIRRNGKTGMRLYPGSQTKVAGVAFELNYQAQDPKPRRAPVVTDGDPGFVKDLLVGKGAITDLTGNSFA